MHVGGEGYLERYGTALCDRTVVHCRGNVGPEGACLLLRRLAPARPPVAVGAPRSSVRLI